MWFENEEFWREFYPAMFHSERLAAADREIDQILALAQFSGHSVLDLCCGPGQSVPAIGANDRKSRLAGGSDDGSS